MSLAWRLSLVAAEVSSAARGPERNHGPVAPTAASVTARHHTECRLHRAFYALTKWPCILEKPGLPAPCIIETRTWVTFWTNNSFGIYCLVDEMVQRTGFRPLRSSSRTSRQRLIAFITPEGQGKCSTEDRR